MPSYNASKKQPSSSKYPPQIHPQLESGFNLISLALRNNEQQKIKASFEKLKKNMIIKRKYSSFLCNKLHFMQKRKVRENMKFTFSRLTSLKFNFYANQISNRASKKNYVREKAVEILGHLYNKIEKSKVRSVLHDIKVKSKFIYKLMVFKSNNVFSRVSAIYLKNMNNGWKSVQLYGGRITEKMRNISRVQKLANYKKQNFIRSAYLSIKNNMIIQKKGQSSSQKQEQPQKKNKLPTKSIKIEKESVAEVQNHDKQIEQLESSNKLLQEEKKNIQKEIKIIESEGESKIGQQQSELSNLQNQNQELGFNNGILDQNNFELEKQLNNKEKKQRKKLSTTEIWQNVYNNLIFFLSKNNGKDIKKCQIMEALELPLVPSTTKVQEINEENQILGELLDEYRKNFPDPEGLAQQQQQLLPFDVIRKQNRYYYLALQGLTEWGTPGSKEIEELTNDLNHLQKKLAA